MANTTAILQGTNWNEWIEPHQQPSFAWYVWFIACGVCKSLAKEYGGLFNLFAVKKIRQCPIPEQNGLRLYYKYI